MTDMAMLPAHLPLLLASDELAPSGEESEPLDRLRMQKAVFIVQQAGPNAWRGGFSFVPWDWGPYSRDLTNEVSRLQSEGLLETEPVEWRRYPRYRTTAQGEELAAAVAETLEGSQLDYLRRVRRYVTSRSFAQLLREVYARFPEYAVNSRFQG